MRNSINITQQEIDNIYQKWEEEIKGDQLVYDGILSIEKWNKLDLRVMFLLKESHNKYYKIAIEPVKIRKGSGPSFFPNILLWKYAIEKAYISHKKNTEIAREMPNYKTFDEWKKNYLDSIAYFNVKKTLGGSSSNPKIISEFATNHKLILKEHINLINPNVIFCDDTTYFAYKNIFEFRHYDEIKGDKILFNEKYVKTNYKPKLYRHNNRLIIRFYHPSYFGKNRRKLYQKLINSLNSQIFDEFDFA